MKLTLTKVSVSDTKKDGSKLETKDGKPFFKVGLQTKEFADQWINGLVFGDRPTWKEGDEVDLIVEDEVYNGVKRKKFEIPKKSDQTLREINDLAIKVGKTHALVEKIYKHLSGEDRLDRNSDGSRIPNFGEAEEDYENM